MKVLAISCSNEQYEKLKQTYDTADEIIQFDKSRIEDPSLYDRIVVSDKSINLLSSIYRDTLYEKLYIIVDNNIIPICNPELLDTLSKEAFINSNWGIVKRINKIKVDLNCLLKKEILDTYPTQVQLESTSFCNAQCIMCNHYYLGNKGAVDMNDDMLVKISELFPYLEVIIMHGNGEPFSSRLFDKCVETYSSYGIKLTTNTNLSILTDKHIDKINESFVDVRVSCDACTKEIYEGIRKNLSFDRFVSNCEKLRDRCKHVYKAMASVMMRQNIEQLPEMVEFAANYGFREILFSNLGTSRIIDNEKDNISFYPYFAAKQLREAIKTGEKLGIKVTVPASFDLTLDDEKMCEKELEIIHSKPFFKTESEVEDVRRLAETVLGEDMRVVEDLSDCEWDNDLYSCNGICEWVIEKPFIDLKGDVFVCCINQSFRVGNIFDYDSFIDLWNNNVYKKIRALFYSGKLPAFCNNCQFILNDTLARLTVPVRDKEFYKRRRISKYYKDYCKEHGNE